MKKKSRLLWDIKMKKKSRLRWNIVEAAASVVLATVLALLIGISVLKPPSPEREISQTVLVETEDGWGSAVTIIRGNMCFAWTAAHVVDKSARVKVHRVYRFQGHKAGEYVCEAHVIKVLPHQDAALLLIEGDPAQFGSAVFSRTPGKPGDKITHVGNVLGPNFDTSFESGAISQNGVRVKNEDCLLDQGSFAIAPGCSGGPVFNDKGWVIGLVVIYVGPGVSLYVPARVLEDAAEEENLGWALHGCLHPPARELLHLIEAREKEVAANPPLDFFQLFFGAPPQKK
jgi:S1-C subfamily serine protease